MQVFLIPIGLDSYEPYFEPAEGADEVVDEHEGWLSRQRRRLSNMLREAEADRHRHHDVAADQSAGFSARWRRKLMRWIVERAAEQRLLWHLRTATEATLAVPDDLATDQAMTIFRQGLKRDSDRHARWFVVHLLGLVGSLALVLVPGPNLLGYVLTFTTLGHLFSWRGAQQGLRRVHWHVEANPHVADVRVALSMASPARQDRVHAIAARLGLRHLATFVERLAIPPA